MTSKILLSVVGPTAIGKTKLAIALATNFDTEIISADSRQFYKELHIGTAVPTKKDLKKAPHHFIQHKSIFDSYTVGDFEKEAVQCLKSIFSKKKIALMVGGSGLYVDAVTKGLDVFPEVRPEIRLELNKAFERKGIQYLQNALKAKDPVYYEKVDLENPHRLIRALEVCVASGKPYSSFLKKGSIKRPFKTVTIGIQAPREIIYDRINKRVDIMIAEGLIPEARSLYEHSGLNALNTVGYKELFKHFNGDCTLDYATEEIKKNSRRFAKRQLTWFRKNKEILWVAYNAPKPDIFKQIENHLKGDL